LIIFERLANNQNYQFWLFQFIFWFFWASIYLIFQYPALVILADTVVALLLTTGLRVIYQAVWDRHWSIRTISVLLGSALAGLLWNIFKRQLELTAAGEENLDLYKNLGLFGYYTYEYRGLSLWPMLSWSGLYLGLTFYHMLQQERATSLGARARAHEAQLRMLRYQLNPHFLFNTLNAISTLILEANNKTANAMVSRLSSFLRYSLDKDPLQKVDLEHEVSTMKLYLEIEKVRFEERLRVEFNIEPGAASALIPSMLLQPLVENSIKYAVADNISGGTIQISAKLAGSEVQIDVQDDGPGIEMENGQFPDFRGVGLRNIKERLKELYGSAQACEIKPAKPHGLHIQIRLPLEIEPVIEPITAGNL